MIDRNIWAELRAWRDEFVHDRTTTIWQRWWRPCVSRTWLLAHGSYVANRAVPQWNRRGEASLLRSC